jgi:hypothetical protein
VLLLLLLLPLLLRGTDSSGNCGLLVATSGPRMRALLFKEAQKNTMCVQTAVCVISKQQVQIVVVVLFTRVNKQALLMLHSIMGEWMLISFLTVQAAHLAAL